MRRLLLAALLLVPLSGCADLLDPAAAVVHGRKISVEEVRAGIAAFETSARFEELAQEQDPNAIRRQFEQGQLATLIRRAVLRPRAEELGVEVSAEDIEGRTELIEASFEEQGRTLQEALAEQGLTEDELHDLVRDEIIEEALREEVTSDVAPTEEEIQAFYEENRDQASEMRAQHILVEREGLARRLAQQLQEADDVDALFAELAREHSTDRASARRGGRLDAFGPGQLVPEFEQAAAQLEIGEVSDPVQSQFGWHVIRVLERRELTVDDMRDQIAQQLLQPLQEEAWEEWLAGAFEAAEVRVNSRYGEFDPRTGQIVDASAEDVPGGEAPAGDPGAPAGFEELEEHDDGHDH